MELFMLENMFKDENWNQKMIESYNTSNGVCKFFIIGSLTIYLKQ